MLLKIDPAVQIALAILVSVLLGTLILITVAVARRRQQELYIRRVEDLRRRFKRVLARMLAGGLSAQGLAGLRGLSMAEREALFEPLLSKGKFNNARMAILQQVCTELGMVEVWQQRLMGHPERISFREALRRPEGLPWSIRRLNFLVRARSAGILGALRHQPSWPLLVRALDDAHPDVQCVALRSLAMIREPQSFPSLVLKLHALVGGNPYRVSERSLRAALANFPLSCAPRLLTSLRHPDARIRSLALDAFRYMVERAVVKHEQPDVDPPLFPREVTELLLNELGSDENPEIRGRAADVITYLDAAQSKPVLARLLHDPQWFVRLRALRAVARFQHLSLFSEVGGCLADSHWRVREAAVQTLLSLGQEGVAQVCDHFLNTDDHASQEQMVAEMERAGVVPILLERSGNGVGCMESRVIEQLVSMGATRFLFAALQNDADSATRLRFVRKFSQHPDPQIQAWVRRLASREADPELQNLAQAPRSLAA